jgi:hypothetical protein
MRFDDWTADWQAEPHAGRLGGVERLEVLESPRREFRTRVSRRETPAYRAILSAVRFSMANHTHEFTAAEFGAYVAAESEKWAKVIQFAGIKPEWSRLAFHKSHDFGPQRS